MALIWNTEIHERTRIYICGDRRKAYAHSWRLQRLHRRKKGIDMWHTWRKETDGANTVVMIFSTTA